MNSTLQFDFIISRETNSITIIREFAAGIELVWEVYSTSEYLNQWWAPKPWKAKTKKFDFRIGGKWLYAMVGPNGEEHWGIAEYLEIVPKQLIEGLDCFCDSDGKINKELPRSAWSTLFEPVQHNTRVRYEITFPDVEQLEATIAMGFNEGITSAFEGLVALLQQLQGK